MLARSQIGFLCVTNRTWNMPFVAKVLASTANYMICDDHEFVDDLGESRTRHPMCMR